MAISVEFSVSKDASTEVHSDAAATGKTAIALLAGIGKQAEALGYNVRVKLRQRATASATTPVAKASPEPIAWGRDLADPRWRP